MSFRKGEGGAGEGMGSGDLLEVLPLVSGKTFRTPLEIDFDINKSRKRSRWCTYTVNGTADWWCAAAGASGHSSIIKNML